MTRVKRGYVARKHRKNILKFTSGFQGAHSKLFRTANQQKMKALAYAQRDRNNRKRDIRRLWITRINAACRNNGIVYNGIIHSMSEKKVHLNRKILAQIAILDSNSFFGIVKEIGM
uniref:Large ribosomal subunit protein bL20c n=2 Tax=Angiopteris TaxID=3266 RepID=RK20_ANGEV|nr:ribosomal protein L20 [Angiopteris evecta]YP_009992453.1 ribosomal protein L20 [Angiopteris yunnanensis]YP_010576366.1 ribosomal protein L20 [Angiopteris fokiensis]A2T356.1 RecName: Full=Large ribosomal subunit protein bL20c; AltName: Full=50S ribosomal protein L20, chloroplastic [Angiopteris evecta]ABG79623.1 ribosomal protein L20 [Angiopteris evecta]QNN90638.1 ribosomal protein L20 [Angiopteris yunnanensis]UZN43907.1 ribosomal protein L20 [Angiopteris fokiensis]